MTVSGHFRQNLGSGHTSRGGSPFMYGWVRSFSDRIMALAIHQESETHLCMAGAEIYGLPKGLRPYIKRRKASYVWLRPGFPALRKGSGHT